MMNRPFNPDPEQSSVLDGLAARVPHIQETLIRNHPDLRQPDRAAHQHQIAGGTVRFDVAGELPPELDGVGIFLPGTSTVGVGRISTGMGCPHLETDPDFLGLMLAFQTSEGARVDFLSINDPAAPADNAEVFMDVLEASAESAGAEVPFGDVGELDLGNLTAAQAKMHAGLRERLGLAKASAVYLHLAKQTSRTVLSSTSVQQYWTGVVETGGRLGKFTFIPEGDPGGHRRPRPGERYLTEDWNARISTGPITFTVWWIPFLSEEATPLRELSRGWDEEHAVRVGKAVFVRSDPTSRESRLVALLASEMGANPGNWVRSRNGRSTDELPATRFGIARQRAYQRGQQNRNVLPEASYQTYFDSGGTVDEALAGELELRSAAKHEAGHAGPLVTPTPQGPQSALDTGGSKMHPTVRKWLSMSRAELDALYESVDAGTVPTGDTRGTAIISGTFLTKWLARFARLFAWQGKVFDIFAPPDTGILINKVTWFSLTFIVAKVYKGPSWMDGKETIIIDYSSTSFFAKKIRDEIREVEPGVYLGKVWWGKKRLIDFALVARDRPA